MSLALRELLIGWGNVEQVIRPVHLPESKTIAACLKVATSDTLKPPQHIDLEQLKKKLVATAEQNDFSHLTLKEWRASPFAVDGAGGLAASPSLLQRYLGGIVKYYNKKRIFRTLASTYARTFQHKSELTSCLGTFLSKYGVSFGPDWAKAQQRYSIFDPEKAARELAKELESQASQKDYSIVKFVKTEGLPELLAYSPLVLAATQQALASITQNHSKLNDERDIGRIIKLTSTGQGTLAFQGISSLVTTLTDALLLPFRHTPAPVELQKIIERYLLHHLGDPRINTARWNGARQESKGVILRWLTEQSLELFLDIVDKVVVDSADAKRMWANRAIFWRSYLKKGYIDAAWVVFEGACQQYAQQVKAKTGAPLAFGRLSAPDVRHAVLMMRIDNLTIVDWSHNGRCHIWYGSSTKTPALYIPYGTKGQLEQFSDEAFRHDQYGAWQAKVASVIYRHTGRRP